MRLNLRRLGKRSRGAFLLERLKPKENRHRLSTNRREPMTDADYQHLSAKLFDLLGAIGGQLLEEDVVLVREFVEAGEFGLALEEMVDATFERGGRVSRELHDEILRLAVKMEIDGELLPRVERITR